jgi:hypothetical protein
MADDSKPVKKEVAWDLVQVDYRANILSLRAIGAKYGVSDAGILKRAKKEGWTRDLTAKIRAKAAEKVSKAAVSAEVSIQTTAYESQVVEANATLQSDIILAHRKDIQRSRRLTMRLLDELEFQTDNLELLEELRELVYAPDDKGVDKRDELIRKVLSLSSRSSTMKTLADSLKTLVTLEREAFGVDEDTHSGGSAIDEVIKRVKAKHATES